MSAYKARMGELANAYWHAHWDACNEELDPQVRAAAAVKRQAIYREMDTVPSDEMPSWVAPELVDLARHFSLNEVREEDGGVYATGHWPFDSYLLEINRSGWTEIERWCNGFRYVWVNSAAHAMFTYCEGDTSLACYPDEAAYGAAFRHATRVYERAGA